TKKEYQIIIYKMASGIINLPPGFCFSPTDEQLVLNFLYSKDSLPCYSNIIPDLHMSLSDPWELNGKALRSGDEYYFFTKVKENKTTENGYWNEIGVNEPIISATDKKVGIKKYLVFYLGEGPRGTETRWVMQEYHICPYVFKTQSYDLSGSKWVLCKVYERKKFQFQKGANYCYSDEDDSGTELSWQDEVFLSLDDDLEEIKSIP
ncbi:hypothetical protein Lal_00049839, partial [Lupinus albus]